MSDAALVAGWGLASVFALAALGKVVGGQKPAEIGLAVLELLMAGALVSGVGAPIVGLAAVAMSLGYFVYALTRMRDDRCACFGSRLPATNRTAQRWRNGSLLIVALAFWVGSVFAQKPTALRLVDASLGVLIGAILTAGPWLFDWARTDSPSVQ